MAHNVESYASMMDRIVTAGEDITKENLWQWVRFHTGERAEKPGMYILLGRGLRRNSIKLNWKRSDIVTDMIA